MDRIGWLREVFAGRMDLWARMYDEAGNPRYAVSILHAWSNLIDPGSDEAFASGFDTVAQHVRDRYQIEVGFTLDTSRGPRYSAGPAAAGPFLARTAPVLAIHGFEAEIFSGKVLIGADNNVNGNISLMADWKRAAMNDWIATGVPVILDVSNGYDARKVFPENPWHWGDNLGYTDDRWRNWVSQLKNPGIAGICVDCWNGYTEGYAMVPSQEHQNTVCNWLADLLEPDPRDYSHMHYENGAATHRVYGAICKNGSRPERTAHSGRQSRTKALPAPAANKASPMASQYTGAKIPALSRFTVSSARPTVRSAAAPADWACRSATKNPTRPAASTASSTVK